jgi:hypothetical protein
VADVRVGKGDLAGKGVYTDRDFIAGEPVITFDLQQIDEAQYLALPAGEYLFVHSYGGRRYLYPAPARFVHHSDEPPCFEDFDRFCGVALRDIAKGEPVTIDAAQETRRELATFLDAYTAALRSRSVPLLSCLIDGGATLWQLGAAARGCDAVVTALLESEPGLVSGVEWVRRHRTLGGRRFGQHADRRAPSAPHHAGQGHPGQLAAGLPTRRLNSRGVLVEGSMLLWSGK